MKYLLLIYGNVTRDEVAAMSEEEQKALYADWGAVNQTPGVTPGSRWPTRRPPRRSGSRTARRS